MKKRYFVIRDCVGGFFFFFSMTTMKKKMLCQCECPLKGKRKGKKRVQDLGEGRDGLAKSTSLVDTVLVGRVGLAEDDEAVRNKATAVGRGEESNGGALEDGSEFGEEEDGEEEAVTELR